MYCLRLNKETVTTDRQINNTVLSAISIIEFALSSCKDATNIIEIVNQQLEIIYLDKDSVPSYVYKFCFETNSVKDCFGSHTVLTSYVSSRLKSVSELLKSMLKPIATNCDSRMQPTVKSCTNSVQAKPVNKICKKRLANIKEHPESSGVQPSNSNQKDIVSVKNSDREQFIRSTLKDFPDKTAAINNLKDFPDKTAATNNSDLKTEINIYDRELEKQNTQLSYMKQELHRKKEKIEERKRSFESDINTYRMIRTDKDEGRIKTVPVLFRDRYVIYKYLDDNKLLNIEDKQIYYLFRLLYNCVNYIEDDVEVLDEDYLIKIYGDYIDMFMKQDLSSEFVKVNEIDENVSGLVKHVDKEGMFPVEDNESLIVRSKVPIDIDSLSSSSSNSSTDSDDSSVTESVGSDEDDLIEIIKHSKTKEV